MRSFMAHHQGMALLVARLPRCCDRPMQRRFEADPALPRHRAAAAGARAQGDRRSTRTRRRSSRRARPSAEAEANLRVFTDPEHAGARGAPAVERALSRRDHQRRRRLQPLARSRRHALARGPDARLLGHASATSATSTSGEFWSAAHQPTLKPAASYEAIFSQGRAEFRRRDGDIETHVEISVSPEDDIELRRVSLTNRGRSRTHDRADELRRGGAGAAGSRCRASGLQQPVRADRDRARATGDPVHAAAALGRRAPAVDDPPDDRARHVRWARPRTRPTAPAFIGRGRSVADPAAMHRAALERQRRCGARSDRRHPQHGRPRARRDGARPRRDRRRRDPRGARWRWSRSTSDRHSGRSRLRAAWTHSQVVLRQLDATEADTQLYERLASNILYANPALRAPASVIARNRSGQSGLWAYGISGDLPIVLVRIARSDATSTSCDSWCRRTPTGALKGLAADLVIWNEDHVGLPAGSAGGDHGCDRTVGDASLLDKPGGIFVRRSDQMSERTRSSCRRWRA